jgi:molybdate transport system ATP-binding protein
MVTRLAGTQVELETPLTDVEAGRPTRVAVRAGDILIATEPPRGLSARNVIPGTIATLVREGPVVRLQVDVGLDIEVHITPTAGEALELQAGRQVWLVIKTHSCHPVTAI